MLGTLLIVLWHSTAAQNLSGPLPSAPPVPPYAGFGRATTNGLANDSQDGWTKALSLFWLAKLRRLP